MFGQHRKNHCHLVGCQSPNSRVHLHSAQKEPPVQPVGLPAKIRQDSSNGYPVSGCKTDFLKDFPAVLPIVGLPSVRNGGRGHMFNSMWVCDLCIYQSSGTQNWVPMSLRCRICLVPNIEVWWTHEINSLNIHEADCTKTREFYGAKGIITICWVRFLGSYLILCTWPILCRHDMGSQPILNFRKNCHG